MARPYQRRLLAKQGAHRIGVALRDRLEESRGAGGVTAVDLGLERAPAREAVLVRDREKRRGKLCARVRLAKVG
jgi:hypothetical protein